MILLLSFDVRRQGGIERLTKHVHHSLQANGYEVILLTPQRIGPGEIGRLLGRVWFLLRLIQLLRCSHQVVSMHVLLLKPLRWMRWHLKKDQEVLCWVHGIEVWGRNRIINRESLELCQRLIASSSFTKQQLEPLSCPISIVHPMADLNDPSDPPAAMPASLTLLTVARMCRSERYKGHSLILEALQELQRMVKLPQGFLWEVVGDGDELPELMHHASEVDLEHWVQFHGCLSDNELRAAFARSSVFVMPSHFSIDIHGKASGEGFGIVYLEAALAGRASIACNEGGQTDLIRDGETGWLIPPRATALAQVLQDLINNPGLAEERGRMARTYALKNFSGDRFSKQIEEALNI